MMENDRLTSISVKLCISALNLNFGLNLFGHRILGVFKAERVAAGSIAR